MKKIILLITIVTINSCLELKFIKKTEYFTKDCNRNLDTILFERLTNECNDE